MKTKLFTFVFLISLSHFAFGQDTINANNLVKGLEINSISGNVGEVDRDLVVARKQTTYILSQQEKDSVWNSIYKNAITQNLLKDDPTIANEKWYLPEHTQNLLAVLNVGTLSYKKRSEVLVKKIYADKERELVMMYGGGRSPYRVKIDTVHSKELAMQNYLNRQLNPHVNFCKSINGIIAFEVDFALDQPLIRANVYKYNSSSLKKIVRIIKRTKIERIDLSGGVENHPPNTLIIYYKKK